MRDLSMTPSEIEAAKGQIHLAFSEALSIAMTEAFRVNADYLHGIAEASCMVDMVLDKLADGETLSDYDAEEYESNLLALAALALVEVAERRSCSGHASGPAAKRADPGADAPGQQND